VEGKDMGNISVTNFIILLFAYLLMCVYIPSGVAGFVKFNETEVEISNEIILDPIAKQAELVYNIKTPKVIHYNFVLALDSSGSIDDDRFQYESIINDVPKFFEKIPKWYPEAIFNSTIISWDNDVDFVYDRNKKYSEINSNNPPIANLAPIENIINDSKKLYIKCNDTEGTDFSVPIETSLGILNAQQNNLKDTYHTKKFVILVTGQSEFAFCRPELLEDANKSKIDIYIIGMRALDNNTEMSNYLSRIAVQKKDGYQPINPGYNYLKAITGKDQELTTALNRSLEAALLKDLELITNSSVADGIEIEDQLYCYYEPYKNTFSITGKGYENSNPNNIDITSLNDGTKKIKIRIPELKPNSITRVAFKARNTFDPMSIPITMSEKNDSMIICKPIKGKPSWNFHYTWSFNGKYLSRALGSPDKHTQGKLVIQSEKPSTSSGKNSLPSMSFLNFLSFFGS
jgi:hypothetical protein